MSSFLKVCLLAAALIGQFGGLSVSGQANAQQRSLQSINPYLAAHLKRAQDLGESPLDPRTGKSLRGVFPFANGDRGHPVQAPGVHGNGFPAFGTGDQGHHQVAGPGVHGAGFPAFGTGERGHHQVAGPGVPGAGFPAFGDRGHQVPGLGGPGAGFPGFAPGVASVPASTAILNSNYAAQTSALPQNGFFQAPILSVPAVQAGPGRRRQQVPVAAPNFDPQPFPGPQFQSGFGDIQPQALQPPINFLSTPVKDSRQGAGRPADVALDLGTIAASGDRCVDKVVVEEETQYDDVIDCKHSYSEECHTTYTTDFQPQQEEECEENFIKNCFIEYKKVASKEKVQFCHTPLVCDGDGPIECKTVYESQCETKFHAHEVEDDVVDCRTVQEEKCEDVTQGYSTERKCTKWPRQVCTKDKQRVVKHSPDTKCQKVPRQLCGPSGCELRPGQEQCFDKDETVVQEVPEENCDLEPQKSCKHVTKLVPLLKPSEECVDVPKEVCSRSKSNPRKVPKPVVKKWCYSPTAQSGLA